MNNLLKIWNENKPVVNAWLSIPNSFTAEAFGKMGWDAITIDMQHGQSDYSSSIPMLQALSSSSSTPMVRVPWYEPGIIMRMLDLGVLGIIAPMINTKEDCEKFVSYCYYPPIGQRSFGPMRAQLIHGSSYFEKANENVLSILENEGRISRSRGKATIILDRLLQNSQETEIKDRSETLNADYKLLDLQIIKNSFIKKFTNSSSLYYINRIRRIKNNEVYLISRAYIPTEIIGKTINKNFFKDKNLLHVLMSKLQIKMKKSEQEVSAISLNKNDSVMFSVNKGYPAVLNSWYFYDYSNKLVLIDQETTIKTLKVKNYYK